MALVGIRAYTGLNGAGKTLCMVEEMAVPAWRTGQPVVSNFRLDPEALGYPADLWQPLESWRQVPDLHDCVLLLDEIQATFPSRESSKMPAELGRMLNQLRKPGVALGYTGPSFARADKLLREVTGAITVCRGFLPDQFERQPVKALFPPKALDDAGRAIRIDSDWLPNRLFKFCRYDAADYEDFTASKALKLKPLKVQWYWRSKHDAHHAYDTSDVVELLDHLDETGACWKCGGTRSRPKCRCADEGARQGAGIGSRHGGANS